MTTYEGLKGRIYGFIWGSIWLTIGSIILAILGVRGDLFPRGLKQFLVEIAPWLEGGVKNSLIGGTIDLLIIGGFIATFVFYGIYHLGRVFLLSDYSITFKGKGP